MKKVFSYKRLEISTVKGFVFGIGWDDSSYILLFGPFLFELAKKPPVLKPYHMNEL